MSDHIYRIDVHSETTPPGVTVKVPHIVNAEVEATQTLVKIGGAPALRIDDKFRCQHLPKVGAFTSPLPGGSGEGKLAQAGHSLLKINGRWAVTQAGTNKSCSETVEEQSNQATTMLAGRPLVKVNGAAVLVGR
jgi:uncharacterized Zn-binding protein involved in type VI secretion